MASGNGMNALFVNAARRRGRAIPGLTRSRRTEAAGTSAALRERLSGALNDLDAAKRAGNDEMRGLAEHTIGRVIEESRAARAPAPEEPAAEQPSGSFDGGVRGRRSPPTPHVRTESANALLLASLTASRVERAARDADPGQTVISKNI